MKRTTVRSLLAAVLGVFAVPTSYADKPMPVTVTNTPLPVTLQGQTTPIPVSVTNPGGGANVTVTNPVTNPVKTSIDQYPRMPVRINAAATSPYTVPDGSRLVVETIAVAAQCASTTPVAVGILFINGTNALEFPLSIAFSGVDNRNFSGIASMRVVLGPSETLVVSQDCSGTPPVTNFASNAFGYLVSVNSPSLAP